MAELGSPLSVICTVTLLVTVGATATAETAFAGVLGAGEPDAGS